MSKEHPILFKAPMVRAILDGSKTQTRRIAPITDLNIKPHSNDMVTWGVSFSRPVKGSLGSYSGGKFSVEQAQRIIASMFNPFGLPGDRLWVRETFAIVPRTAYRCSEGVQQTLRPNDDHDAAIYRAGWDRSNGGFRWRPSIHMPRWASRITLEIVSVRVERLQDVSEEDAIAEGIDSRTGDKTVFHFDFSGQDERFNISGYKTAKSAYIELWRSINGPGSWDANPWVWVVEFKRVEA